MTIKECYDMLGANYEEALHRLMKDALVKRFALKFLADSVTFPSLEKAMAEKDYDAAFHAAHTLKGNVLNLSLKNLEAPVVNLTEDLRAGGSAASQDLFDVLKEEYMRTRARLQDVQDSEE